MPIALETASHGLLWPLLTSARTLEYRSPDLPRHLRRRARRPPRVRTMAFLPHPPDLLVPPFGQRASSCTADLPGDTSLIRFLFVGSEFRIRLPSGHTSRWNPCPLLTVLLTYGSGLSPVVIAHAGHTVPPRCARGRATPGSASLRSQPRTAETGAARHPTCPSRLKSKALRARDVQGAEGRRAQRDRSDSGARSSPEQPGRRGAPTRPKDSCFTYLTLLSGRVGTHRLSTPAGYDLRNRLQHVLLAVRYG